MQPIKEENNAYIEKISCKYLRPGMYVHELDRPWLETPFMFQGFLIKDDEEIETLQKYCEDVYVDTRKETTGLMVIHSRTRSKSQTVSCVRAIANKASPAAGKYTDTVIVEKELKVARKIYEEGSESIEEIFKAALSSGVINQHDINKTTFCIVDSVLRNPDAFMLLQSIKRKDKYRYSHAINCCALAATFCRHLGFSKTEIQNISMGALLLDIGVTKLPESMISTQGPLNPLLMKLVRSHVDFGLEILDTMPKLPHITREMIKTHHERMNGTGYPNGLKGEQIPVCGRIAAIIDCYDAMISNRPHKNRISPTDAICSLYEWRDVDFHEDLIEQFIQCIGAYPTGSLVELNSGQIGIVMSQNRVHHLYPKVLLILNADKIKYERPSTVDLWEHAQRTQATILNIKTMVDADELVIDPSDYYL